MFSKTFFFLNTKKHLNLQVCTKQTAAAFIQANILHAVSGCTLSAGLSVFDLKQRNRSSSNTSFVKSIYNAIKINISFI